VCAVAGFAHLLQRGCGSANANSPNHERYDEGGEPDEELVPCRGSHGGGGRGGRDGGLGRVLMR
jgi:hypothetical protein